MTLPSLAICFCLLAGSCGGGSSFVIGPPAPSQGEDPEEEDPHETDPPATTADPATLDNDATCRTMEIGLGWNLGNNLDAYEEDPEDKDYLMPSETVWGNKPITQAALQKVRDAGFTSIRIPVTWLAKIGPAPEYKIDAAWMARVTEVVGYAHNVGFKNVIVDTHHDEDHDDNHWQDLKNAANNPALNKQIKEEIKAVWGQIARNFANCGEWLMFEGFNELNDGGWGHSSEFKANPYKQCNIINEWLQVFVDTVRESGGYNETRWLGVSPYCGNPQFAKYLVFPNDPAHKLMLGVHFYDPSDYTLGKEGSDGKDYLPYSDWGHTSAPGKSAGKYNEDFVDQTFSNLFYTYIANNIPVYIGETGCSMRALDDVRGCAFRKYYLEYVFKAARSWCLPCTLWDCGGRGVPGPEHHPYFKRDTGDYYDGAEDVVKTIVKAWCSDDPDYTLKSVYDSAPKL